MVVLNDGSPTHQGLGRLDLTIVSSALAPKCTWQVSDSIASDHYAIITTISTSRDPQSPPITPKFNFAKADWPVFQHHLDQFTSTFTPSPDLQHHNQEVTTAFQRAAIAAIPRTRPNVARREAWYYNEEIKIVKAMVNQHVRLLKSHPTPQNRHLLREALQHAREVSARVRSDKWFECYCW